MITHTGSSSFIFKGKMLMKEEGVLECFAGRALISPLLRKNATTEAHPQFLYKQTFDILCAADQSKIYIYTPPSNVSYFSFFNKLKYFPLVQISTNPVLRS